MYGATVLGDSAWGGKCASKTGGKACKQTENCIFIWWYDMTWYHIAMYIYIYYILFLYTYIIAFFVSKNNIHVLFTSTYLKVFWNSKHFFPAWFLLHQSRTFPFFTTRSHTRPVWRKHRRARVFPERSHVVSTLGMRVVLLFFCLGCLSTTWNSKQPFINGWFDLMIPNLYLGNGCVTKHTFKNGC